jgi:hypothetical protein
MIGFYKENLICISTEKASKSALSNLGRFEYEGFGNF